MRRSSDPPSDDARSAPSHPMSDPPSEPLRAFVVEDDPVHRMILERIAGRLGGQVEVVGMVSTRTAADEAIAGMERAPDVVLLDLTLPDSALEETVAALPTLLERWGTRIVGMSALDDPALPGRVRGKGAAAFLSKDDLSVERLRDAIRTAAPTAAPPDAPAAADPGPPPLAKDVAARLAHDVLAWISAGKFRLTALRRAKSLEDALLHADALNETYDAIAAAVAAARGAVTEETMALEVAAADAVESARGAADAWLERTADAAGRVEVSLAGATGAVRHAREGLARAVEALLDNALRHARADAGPIRVHVEGRPGLLVVTDDGGPWDVAAPARLGEPASPGRRGTLHAGMGLFRARRLMERMGGALRVSERADVPGAFAVTLAFGLGRA